MEESQVKINTSLPRKALCLGLTMLLLSSAQLVLAKTTKFNANVFYEKGVPMSGVGYGEWAKILEKESNGSLKAKVFYGGVLAPPRASLTAVSDGLAEIGHIPAMYTPSDLPVSNLLHELSANFTDSLAMMAAITEYNFTNKELQDQYKKWNLIFGGAYSTPEYRIFCKDKVTTLDEMKGKKIRTLGAGSALLVKQMGDIPVNVPSSEMYSGLEKGILDCAANAVSDLKARSLWDVSKHTTLISLGIFYVGPQWGIRTSFWEQLDAPARKALLKSFAFSTPLIYQEYQNSNATVMKEAAGHGVTFHEPSKQISEMISNFEINNIERAIAVGKEKNMVADPEKFVGDFINLYNKWVKLLVDVDRNDSEAVGQILMTNIYDKVDVNTYPN
jgi:TRAP-type C4-dicarboxylate transport system substrate-binding protein